MFLFPLIYIAAFIYALLLLSRKNILGVLVFIVFGLPIYMHALSVTYSYGFLKMIPALIAFKEIIVVIGLYTALMQVKNKPRLHLIDALILIYFAYTFLFAVLPIGSYSLFSRLVAFKSLSFFVLIYFIGRFCNAKEINITQLFSYICMVAVVAALVLSFEVITDQYLHLKTGFPEFMDYYYNAQPTGTQGLSWTFESSLGKKRFGSIFSDPLEFSASIVLILCVSMALSTNKKFKIRFSNFNITIFAAALFCIIFAISRASFAGFFLLIYCYGWISHNKTMVKIFHYFFILIAVTLIFFFANGDLYDLIINTLSFQEASTVGHLLQWIEGVTAIINHPLGLGLGESGRISMTAEQNTGGENQLIIIGVQAGIISVLLYAAIYIQLIRTGLKHLPFAKGKRRKVILAVVLLKIGLIIPLMTSYIDSFNYLTYVGYFLSGLMVNMIMQDEKQTTTSKLFIEQPSIT